MVKVLSAEGQVGSSPREDNTNRITYHPFGSSGKLKPRRLPPLLATCLSLTGHVGIHRFMKFLGMLDSSLK